VSFSCPVLADGVEAAVGRAPYPVII